MSEEELDHIIRQGEGLHAEFKRRPDKTLADEMVAFANASGGKILLGVDDDGKVQGLQMDNQKRSKVQDQAQNCDPPIPIELESFPGRGVTVVHVPKSENKPHQSSNGCFLRQGPNSQNLGRDEIIDFLEKEGRVRFDTRLRKDVPYRSVVDVDKVFQFIKESGQDPERFHPDLFLRNLGVLKGEEEELHLTNAGLLFFSDRLTRDIPQAAVQCVAFKGRDKADILDHKVLKGDVISNIKESMLFLERHLNQEAVIEGIRRKDELEIPEEALREAIVNAIAHRDYHEEGAEVVIEVYKDRVKVTNPGGLPPGFPEERFGEHHLSRNQVIVDLLQRTNYIEKLGTGIDRIKKELSKAHLPPPEFHYDSFFVVTMPRNTGEYVGSEKKAEGEPRALSDHDTISDTVNDTVNDKVKERLVGVIELLYREPGLRSRGIAERMGVSKVTAKRDMQKLSPLVRFEGPQKTGGFYLNERIKAEIEQKK